MNRGKEKRVLIVGAGCFGLSTAYYFLQSNQAISEGASTRLTYKVTVVDASTILPAFDAASSDLNKIVRSSYSDKFYTQLAREAISLWKEGNICGNNTYHESVPPLGYGQPTLPIPRRIVPQSLTLLNIMQIRCISPRAKRTCRKRSRRNYLCQSGSPK
jgi:hypothetical protein